MAWLLLILAILGILARALWALAPWVLGVVVLMIILTATGTHIPGLLGLWIFLVAAIALGAFLRNELFSIFRR